jgi:hypothetical protein
LLLAATEIVKLKRDTEFTKFSFDVKKARFMVQDLLEICGQSMSRLNADPTYHNTDNLYLPLRSFLVNAMVAFSIQRKVSVRLAVPRYRSLKKEPMLAIVHDLRFLAESCLLDVHVYVNIDSTASLTNKSSYETLFLD